MEAYYADKRVNTEQLYVVSVILDDKALFDLNKLFHNTSNEFLMMSCLSICCVVSFGSEVRSGFFERGCIKRKYLRCSIFSHFFSVQKKQDV